VPPIKVKVSQDIRYMEMFIGLRKIDHSRHERDAIVLKLTEYIEGLELS
jgi:hypothetical protein